MGAALFLAFFAIGCAIVSALLAGAMLIWGRRDDRNVIGGWDCTVCGDPHCIDPAHLARHQLQIEQAREARRRGREVERAEGWIS